MILFTSIIALAVLVIAVVIAYRTGRKDGNYSGWCEGWNQANRVWLDNAKEARAASWPTNSDSEASEDPEPVADPK